MFSPLLKDVVVCQEIVVSDLVQSLDPVDFLFLTKWCTEGRLQVESRGDRKSGIETAEDGRHEQELAQVDVDGEVA